MATAAQAGTGLNASDSALAPGLFRYVWQEGGAQQVRLCVLAAVVFPLTMVPLELQRRIIDRAIGNEDLRLLALLGAVYLAVVLAQGGLKYLLRFYRGVVGERAIRRLRRLIQETGVATREDSGRGEIVSIISAEVERVGGFVGEAFSEPVLQIGIFVSILGYMLFVEPLIAIVSLGFFMPQLIFVPLLQRAVNRRARRKVELVRELGELVVAPHDDAGVRYRDRLDGIYRVRLQYYALKFLIKFLNNLMNHLAPLSVLTVGGYLVTIGLTTIGTVASRELLAYYCLAAESRVQYQLIARRLVARAA